jgi:hypothetical protein
VPHPDVPLARTLGLGAMIGARIFVPTGMGAGEPGQQQPRRTSTLEELMRPK